MAEVLRAVPGVCDVTFVRGDGVRPQDPTAPALLLEVPHGATRLADYAAVRAQLRGACADGLRDFFCVNTDVGAPELAHAVAAAFVRAQPARSAVVLRCLLPRTFVDCNRRIDATTVPAGSAAGEPTPGLPPWIEDREDRALLLRLYAAYRAAAETAFATVCGGGGFALMVHTYAPRSIDVPVDVHVAERLRAEYAPGHLERWPLRAPVDLITHDPDGRELGAPALAERAHAAFTAAGFEVVRNGAYTLHPVTLAHTFAVRWPGRTLCLEVRRDLLVEEFTPFAEMPADPARVARAAAPLAAAVAAATQPS